MARDQADRDDAPAASTVSETGSAVVRHDDLTAHPGWRALEQAQREVPVSAIGRYQVLRALGAGGMGMVYEALDPSLDRRVALKVLRRPERSADQQARFAREARSLARLQHPNVVGVYDTGESERGAFVVMQLVDGEPMDRVMARGPLPWRRAVAMVTAAGRGLAAAHAAGIVHRDVKPSNILIDRDGTVRVGDFGLARSFEEATPESGSAEAAGQALAVDVTQTGAVLGTPRYMAPEQHLGQPATARSDQFSLCVTLYEVLYGVHPFAPASRDMTIALAAMRVDAVRPAPPEARVPRRIERALRRGLRFDPGERFPSMDALSAALRPRQRRSVIVALALITAVAAMGYAWARGTPTSSATSAPRGPGEAIQLRRLTRLGDVDGPEVSPDGARLAYRRGSTYYVRDLVGHGGPDRRMGDAPVVYWSPSSDRLLLQGDPTTRIVALDGTLLHSLPRAGYVWSTDDEVASFLKGGKEVVFVDFRTGAKRRCVVPGAYDWLLHVEVSARSGRAIAVTTARNRATIWTFERDCSRMRALLVERNRVVWYASPARWSAEGDAVVVPRGYPGRVSLDVVPLAWPWMRRSIVSGIDLSWYSVGPDGSVYYAENSGAAHVWRLSDQGAPARLTDEARPRWNLQVTSDGALATYVERSESSSSVIAHALNDSFRTVLFDQSFAGGEILQAALSPDQRQLAIAGDDGDRAVGRVLDRAGASPRALAHHELEDVDGVSWSGDRVFFRAIEHDDYVMLDGHGRRSRLVADPSVGWVFSPMLSPDGRTVAVSWNRRTTAGVWSIDLETRAERALAEDLKPVGWSRDGAWIYASDMAYDWLWKVPADGGAAKRWLRAGSLGKVGDVAVTRDGDAVALVSGASSDLFVAPGVAR